MRLSRRARGGHSCVTHSRNPADTGGHERTWRGRRLSTGGHRRSRWDTGGHDIRPVRDREAPNGVMTAKMTANMADGGGRLWTATESPRLRSNSAGPSWTYADARLAVFKTVYRISGPKPWPAPTRNVAVDALVSFARVFLYGMGESKLGRDPTRQHELRAFSCSSSCSNPRL
jgi:hypothetical protein